MVEDSQALGKNALEEIAVIGLAGRFPGSANLDHFWQNLINGIEGITQFTNDELISRGVPRAWVNRPDYVKAGTLFENFDKFDAAFFGYSPVEAETIDPQQRIFLETAWQALEHAGYHSQTHDGSIGVFGGSNPNHYQEILPSNDDCSDVAAEMERLIGNEKDFLCTRVSYKLNLRGPSFTVQTGCSTSLVAVHLACQNLLNYQCSMALAGGVSINLKQCMGYFFQEGTIVCPDGHCRAFDARAQGTVLGQGVGVVVLKRLSEALTDGDTIYAVIKATAINNDGALKAGFTAPSVDGQAEVVAIAHALADISADTVSYIEAHGTGTSLGDPIEVAALTQAFRATTRQRGFCAIGSVKTNIGHADAAAGIAGLIKTILMLHHKKIPPSLHFVQPNPNIDFENSPFYVPTRLLDWKVDGFPRRAGVSSFGIGGTNVHAVLEEAPPMEDAAPSRSWQLLVLSAQTGSALEKATAELCDHLKAHPQLNLADAAHTLQTGRKALPHRRALVCRDTEDAVALLASSDPQRVLSAYQEPTQRDIAFMFSGQGAQYVQMGLELYEHEPEFRGPFDRCSDILESHLSLDLRDVVYPTEGQIAEQARRLQQTYLAQPALFAIEYALAKLWMSWGITPAVFIGHSIGEYVAACLAGVFALEDALDLVAARGRLMQGLPPGSMLAVPLSEDVLGTFLTEELSLAAVNSPSFGVVSGPREAVADLEQRLQTKNILCTRLHTSHGFHSQMMDPILAEFTDLVKGVQLHRPQIPIASSVSGRYAAPEDMTNPAYWARNLRQTVRFSEAVSELLKEPDRIFLEVGPGQTLCVLTRQHMDTSNSRRVLSSIRHPEEKKSDLAFILTTLSRLWLAGIQPDWSGFYRHERRRHIPLPTYPFERQRFWPVQPQAVAQTSDCPKRPVQEGDLSGWFSMPSWKRGRPLERHTGEVTAGQPCSWLIFLDECGIGAGLVQRLTARGHRVTTVTAGASFQTNSTAVYSIDPTEKAHYWQLLQALRSADRIPEKIAHLWCLTREVAGRSNENWLRLCNELGFNSLLFLAQAIGDQLLSQPLQIKVVFNQLFDVTGEEVLIPAKALLLGPCRVIAHEYPNVRCAGIDLVLPQNESPLQEAFFDLLLQELTTQTDESLVAHRGRHRWIRYFEPLSVERSAGRPSILKTGGVYLITGGLGGIGLTLAEHLAQSAQAKLVLVARTKLPPRDQWPRWLETHGEEEVTRQKILKIEAIEKMGAEVLTIAADVAEGQQMRSAVALAMDRFKRIDGVIHAAGIAGGGVIQLKTAAGLAEMLAPKIKGLNILADCFKGSQLDFLILCSALSALFGEAGQTDYCAANAFLDAFARKYHHELNIVSVDWGTWQEVGMAVNTEVPPDLRAARERNIQLGIAPEDGKKAFNHILNHFLPQVVVSPPELFRRFETGTLVTDSDNALGSEVMSATDSVHHRPDLSSVYVVPGNATEEAIAGIWQELLKIDKVGVYDNFFDLGGHSLLATRLLARLRSAFPVEFTMADLFERPTVHSLSALVVEQQSGLPAFAASRDRGQRRKEVRLQRMNPKRNRVAREEFENI
jgi:acyl transferase domain-containing protein/acyl carrier protein